MKAHDLWMLPLVKLVPMGLSVKPSAQKPSTTTLTLGSWVLRILVPVQKFQLHRTQPLFLESLCPYLKQFIYHAHFRVDTLNSFNLSFSNHMRDFNSANGLHCTFVTMKTKHLIDLLFYEPMILLYNIIQIFCHSVLRFATQTSIIDLFKNSDFCRSIFVRRNDSWLLIVRSFYRFLEELSCGILVTIL